MKRPSASSASVPRFHDSLAREVLPVPVPAGTPVSFYACGITPYAPAHIGHARSFVVFDLMARVLRAHGYPVSLVRNITDIDDKILAQARCQGIDWHGLAHGFADTNRKELALLGVSGHEEPSASDHIGAIVDLVRRLVDKGHAYQAKSGDVLFEVASFQRPGAALMPHDDQALLAHGQHRVAHDEKRSPLDFVLWKPSKPGEPSWPSPWGAGRPGWHVECSAMIQHRFADTLAYHGGGTDLRFPHHQAEILQSEAAFGRPLAHRWVHHGSVHDARGRKMSKSLGNTVSIAQALDRARSAMPGQSDEVAGSAVRLALLSTLWTKPLDWSDGLVDAAVHHLLDWAGVAPEGAGPHPSQFLEILADNLNTPKALAWLHAKARAGRKGDLMAARDLRGALDLMGLVLPTVAPSPSQDVPKAAAALLRARQALRDRKDWAGADEARAQLEALGWAVKDGPDGTRLEPLTLVPGSSPHPLRRPV